MALFLVLLAVPQEVEREPGWDLFPDWRLFDPLLADPRWPHFSAAYHYHTEDEKLLRHAAAVSFGEYFSLAGYDAGDVGRWELGVQAGVFAVFDLQAESFDLINADYQIGAPLAWREGPVSAQARVYHQSSHLGDEFLLSTTIERINFSFEGVDVLGSYEGGPFRVYAGGGYLIHTDPGGLDRGSARAGLEFDAKAEWFQGSTSPVGAVDVQHRELGAAGLDVSARLGLEFKKPETSKRRILLLAEYYRGRNPDGQFFDRKVELWGLGLHLHF